MMEKYAGKFTRYEVARILGARSLQLAMDAPILLKFSDEDEKQLNYDTLKIAEKELESEVLPITVKRPLPKKSEKIIKKLTEKEIKEKLEKQAEILEKERLKEDSKKESIEDREEKEIAEEGEIMEIANPDDEEDGSEDDGKTQEII